MEETDLLTYWNQYKGTQYHQGALDYIRVALGLSQNTSEEEILKILNNQQEQLNTTSTNGSPSEQLWKPNILPQATVTTQFGDYNIGTNSKELADESAQQNSNLWNTDNPVFNNFMNNKIEQGKQNITNAGILNTDTQKSLNEIFGTSDPNDLFSDQKKNLNYSNAINTEGVEGKLMFDSQLGLDTQNFKDNVTGKISRTEVSSEKDYSKWAGLTQQGVSMLGNTFDAIGGGSGTQNTATTQGINQIGEMATKIPGIGGLIATAAIAANKVANNTYNKTDEYQDQSIGTQIFGSNVLGILGVNNYGSKRFGKFGIDPTLRAQIGAAYGGSMKNMDYVTNNISGKKVGTFDVGKMQKKYDTAQQQYNATARILENANDILARSSEMSAINSNRRLFELGGGYDLSSVYAAKQGMKLDTKPVQELKFIYQEAPEDFIDWQYSEVPSDWIEKVEEGTKLEWQYQEAPDDFEIEKFAKGGAFNVIPEGALHAHKHNMDTDLDITKKGVPVIDNQGNQQAEIELNEIIFRLEVTQLIEELLKEYESENTSQKEKDECAIEAGKLLVDEILYNTQDRTNLIEQVQ